MVSRPSLRARVYWLTSLIAELQPNIFDETPNDHTSQGQSTASSFLSHLSTLCIPRVVALTSSTYTSHGTTIQVFSTPDSNNATGKVRHSVVHADTSSSTLCVLTFSHPCSLLIASPKGYDHRHQHSCPHHKHYHTTSSV